jgi:hypothetical protein
MTPPLQDDLLARFSNEVDLPAYLGQRGFEVVADARNAAYIAMAHRTSGQILLVAREADGRAWTYKSATDPRDRGSVADYLERHERLSKPAALERVVACLDARRRDVPEAERYRAYLHDKPRALVEAESRHAVAVRERSEALKALARVGIRTSAMPEWRVGGLEGGAVDKIFSEPAEIWANLDCASLNCVTFYVDHDGDGYGETNKTVQFCEEPGAAAPAGYVTQGGDCCDADANAVPGQAKYFTSADACGSWDYNCDGTIQGSEAGLITYASVPVSECGMNVHGSGCGDSCTEAISCH